MINVGYNSVQLGTELSVPLFFPSLIFPFFSWFTMETGILAPKLCSENIAWNPPCYCNARVSVCVCLYSSKPALNTTCTARTASWYSSIFKGLSQRFLLYHFPSVLMHLCNSCVVQEVEHRPHVRLTRREGEFAQWSGVCVDCVVLMPASFTAVILC